MNPLLVAALVALVVLDLPVDHLEVLLHPALVRRPVVALRALVVADAEMDGLHVKLQFPLASEALAAIFAGESGEDNNCCSFVFGQYIHAIL